MIDGENINRFDYMTLLACEDKDYEFLFNKRIVSLECKHITEICEKTNEIYERAVKSGHEWCVLGSHRNGTVDSEKKVITDMMENLNFNRPIRLVITSDGAVWADNTHTVIAYVLRYGEDLFVKEIPFYIVDTRYSIPRIVSVKNTVNDSVSDIKSAIACSERLNARLARGYRPKYLRWNIADLMEQLNFGGDYRASAFNRNGVLYEK